jgi:hypothetical protein
MNSFESHFINQNTDGLFKHANLPALGSVGKLAFRGVKVLIPLCGDTPALKFFAELGCHVTGVELVQTVSASCYVYESD